MTGLPLASVVVPVFNGMRYLPKTLNSILGQDYPNLEIVLVDGGSSDGSVEWLHELTDTRIRTHYLPTGSSAAIAWTIACEQARGAFVKMMGQDDLLRPDAIGTQVSAIRHIPQAGMTTGLRDIIAADDSVLFRARGLSGLHPGLNSGADVLDAAYRAGTNIIGEPFAVLFRREALMAALPWSDSRPLLLDLDLYSKVLDQWDLVTEYRAIGSFRVSAQSWSTRMARDQLRQFRLWQVEYEHTHGQLGPLTHTRARFAAIRQTWLRRLAYAVLRAKGALHPPPLN